jgi:hypothetical protein
VPIFDCSRFSSCGSLTVRLEDVEYRFALADTDEKLERTLNVRRFAALN